MTIDWEKRYGFSGSPTAEWWAQVAENGKAHLILQEFPGDPLISACGAYTDGEEEVYYSWHNVVPANACKKCLKIWETMGCIL